MEKIKYWSWHNGFELSLVYKSKQSENFVLDLWHNSGNTGSCFRIGHFIKQPDGTFNFEYRDEEARKEFSAILTSKNPVKQFYCGQHIQRKMDKEIYQETNGSEMPPEIAILQMCFELERDWMADKPK